MANSEPPMAWRYCGNQIKRWRERAGVTREALAEEASCSYEYVKSMEAGRRKPTLHLLQVADGLCVAGGLLVAAREFLEPEKFPSYSQDYMRCEAEAPVISWYEPLLVPGLLQTEETARALFAEHWPPLDDETIDVRVTARLERQRLLDNQVKSFNFVLSEVILRYPVGNAAEHARQLARLLELGERRNVVIQVLPFEGAHPGLLGPFVLLEMPDHGRLAYEEGQTTGVLYSDPEKIRVVTQRHAMILRQALSREESARSMRKLAEAL